MTPLEAMFVASCEQKNDGPTSCLLPVVAALPARSKLLEAYNEFRRRPYRQRKRALESPLRTARLVARMLNLAATNSEGHDPAWGIVKVRDDGRDSFAFRSSGVWWVHAGGMCRVHPSRLLAAWEVR